MKTSIKLVISSPSIGGISVKYEIELPVVQMMDVLRRKPELHDADAWFGAVRFALQFVFDDMHTTGEVKGGWGQSYADRYMRQTYPNGAPHDIVRQPDSPSGTAMVVEGLSDLLAVDDLLDGNIRELIAVCMRETGAYLRARTNPETGASGVITRLSEGDSAPAFDVRHTAMSLRAWSCLPGQYDYVVRCCKNLVDVSNGIDLGRERSLTVAAVWSALNWIETQNHLQQGVPGADQIPFLRKKAEVALTKQWSHACRGWYDGANARTTANWYTAFVLKELGRGHPEFGDEMNRCLREARQALMDKLRVLPGDQCGLPYVQDGSPDLGMSCMLFNIFARSEGDDKNVRDISRSIGRFITRCTTDLETAQWTEDTYPWTLASLFSALRTMLEQAR